MAGKHAEGRTAIVGRYVRKWRGRPALAIVARLVAERNANRPAGAYAEPMPTRGTVTRHSGR